MPWVWADHLVNITITMYSLRTVGICAVLLCVVYENMFEYIL